MYRLGEQLFKSLLTNSNKSSRRPPLIQYVGWKEIEKFGLIKYAYYQLSVLTNYIIQTL
jgi:hypothetical protein